MKKLSIQVAALCSVFGFVNNVSATDCITAPDCATLGYTVDASSCSGAALYCPWDLSKAACKMGAVTCAVGSILGGDQLCYSPDSGTPDGVEPVGIVFDATNQLAVALTDINESGTAGSTKIYWSSSTCDLSGLDNCTSSGGLTSCETDGRTNTDFILASSSLCDSTPAATATQSYEPSGCSADFCKTEQWFLPSMNELITLFNAKSTVNASLSSTSGSGATALTESGYWSSNEYGTSAAWYLQNGSSYYTTKVGTSNYVRPVVYYGTSCRVENCLMCETGKTDSCGSCAGGYVQLLWLLREKKTCEIAPSLDTDVDDSNTFTCSDSTVQTTCNGMTCCCPADDLCGSSGSGLMCLCNDASVY